MIFPPLCFKLQRISPKADLMFFFFANEELLLDHGLEKKRFIMKSRFISLL